MTTNTIWSAPKLWPDSTVFIIGGGKSLNTLKLDWKSEASKKRIRENISENLRCIHNKRVIGVNNAYELGNWVDVCFYGDIRWYEWNRRKLAKYAGLMVCCHPANKVEWVKTIQREQGSGINKNPDRVFWNMSSGGAAINLAVHLGASKIVLLGFDMFAEKAGEDNWHKEHVVPNDFKNSPYARMLGSFDVIKKDADELGIEIINTSLESKIKCFEKKTFEKVMEDMC